MLWHNWSITKTIELLSPTNNLANRKDGSMIYLFPYSSLIAKGTIIYIVNMKQSMEQAIKNSIEVSKLVCLDNNLHLF